MYNFEERVRQRVPYNFELSPGLALCASVHCQETLRLELGKANLEHDIAFTVDTVSHSASITKQFTAYLLGVLAGTGEISLTTKVIDILPGFPPCGRDITLDHLVHHTSGLRDQWDLLLMGGWRLDDVITADHIWRLILSQQELNFPPGTEMLYSNSGYSVLARALSIITDQSLKELIKRHIAGPLGLTSTFTISDHREVIMNRAYGYGLSGDRFARNDISFATAGATSLWSTASELLRWGEHANQIHAGPVGRILHTPGKTNDGGLISYAHGVRVHDGETVLYHDGWDAGYRAAVICLPEEQIAVALLSNGLEIPAIQIAFDAVEAITGRDLRPAPAPRVPAPAEPAPDIVFSAEELAGTYRSPELHTEYTVGQIDDRLVLSHSRHPTVDLSEVGGNVYKGPNWMPNLRFSGTKRGVDTLSVSTDRVRGVNFEKI